MLRTYGSPQSNKHGPFSAESITQRLLLNVHTLTIILLKTTHIPVPRAWCATPESASNAKDLADKPATLPSLARAREIPDSPAEHCREALDGF